MKLKTVDCRLKSTTQTMQSSQLKSVIKSPPTRTVYFFPFLKHPPNSSNVSQRNLLHACVAATS